MAIGIFSPLLLILAISVTNAADDPTQPCVDGVHNVLHAETYEPDHPPVTVNRVTMLTYDDQARPSCFRGRANIVLPGYMKIASGNLHVPEDFDIMTKGMVHATVWLNDDKVCDDGRSTYFFLPDSMCGFPVADRLPQNMGEMLQKKGTHTVQDVERELGFNSTMHLPPSPSFLGMSLIDVMSGDYATRVRLMIGDRPIVSFSFPSGAPSMQIGLYD